jgi:hypothetical protein
MLLCLFTVVGVAYYRQVIIPSDVFYLPGYLDLGLPLITLISWVVYGELIRLNGGLRFSNGRTSTATRQWLPVMCGALMGELAAVALLAPQAKNNAARGRVALAAVAGGLLSPIGDANLLIVSQQIPNLLLFMIPLGLIGVLIANPQVDDLETNEDSKRGISIWLAIVPVLLFFLVPQNAPLILLECVFLLGLFSFKKLGGLQFETLAWIAVLSGMLVIASAAGLPEFIALGSESTVLNYTRELPALLAAGAILAGSFIDSSISGVFVAGFIDRALDLSHPRYHFAFAAGFAISGILPFVIGKCLRVVLKRYVLFCSIGLVYIWFVSNWLYGSPA